MANEGDQKQGEMAKKKEPTLFDFEQTPESQDQSYRQQREDLRFIIGLATGALVFSVTFVEKIAPVPKYKALLVAGWGALLVSILVGIEVWRRMAALASLGSALDQTSRLWVLLAQGPFEKHILVELLSGLGSQEGESKEETVDQLREKYKKDLTPEHIEKMRRRFLGTESDKRPGAQGLVDELLAGLMKMGSLLDWLTKGARPKAFLKSARTNIFLLVYLIPVSLYSFYLGTLLIALFGILNFLF